MYRIVWRFYNDYLMPSRLSKLEQILSLAQEKNYRMISLGMFNDIVKSDSLKSDQKYLILRNDVDTDSKLAGEIWRLEQSFMAYGSFYFRLQTADKQLMLDIHESGSEVGYHFEEIATLAKAKGIKDASSSNDLLVDAATLFCKNLQNLRNKTGLPLEGIASHGDFVNRRLGFTNNKLLTDKLRKSMQIAYEAYDKLLVDKITTRIADRMYPDMWYPIAPSDAISRGDSVIQLLIHPRQWRRNPIVNTKDNLLRCYEGVMYFLA